MTDYQNEAPQPYYPPQAPGYSYPPPIPPQRHGGLAVAALVLGILAACSLGWFVIGAILAVIFGAIAWRNGARAKWGFWLGIVSLAAFVVWIIAIAVSASNATTGSGSGVLTAPALPAAAADGSASWTDWHASVDPDLTTLQADLGSISADLSNQDLTSAETDAVTGSMDLTALQLDPSPPAAVAAWQSFLSDSDVAYSALENGDLSGFSAAATNATSDLAAVQAADPTR